MQIKLMSQLQMYYFISIVPSWNKRWVPSKIASLWLTKAQSSNDTSPIFWISKTFKLRHHLQINWSGKGSWTSASDRVRSSSTFTGYLISTLHMLLYCRLYLSRMGPKESYLQCQADEWWIQGLLQKILFAVRWLHKP